MTKKKYRFVFVDEYYSGFLKEFRSKNPNLKDKSYLKQRETLLSHFFGTSDSYSYNLRKLGYEAQDLIVNDEILQRKWAGENRVNVTKSTLYSKIQMFPLVHKVLGRPKWVQEITLAQIKKIKPDIVYVQNLSILNPSTLKNIKAHSKLLVGQIASSLPAKKNLTCFDLILTSFPHYVERFKSMGIASEYLKIGFDNRILKKIGKQPKKHEVVFIGSLSPHHKEGTIILERVAEKIPISIWGQGIQFTSKKSPIRKRFQGSAWGLDMYKILSQSRIVINRHIQASDGYANNMRLYESTGMGSLLITDDKKNISDLFVVGKEIITYKNTSDLIKKLMYFMKNKNEASKIAKKGQMRTLKEHTYQKRMMELVNILNNYL